MCINNTPPIGEVHIELNAPYRPPDLDAAHEDEILFGDFNDIYDYEPEIHNIIPIINIIDDEIPLLAPPAGFDMNAASSVEHSPAYMDQLINTQLEYQGHWYFALAGQIYSVPYEIEIDDDHVRQDIRDNWDGVQWRGTIFGEYIAWL